MDKNAIRIRDMTVGAPLVHILTFAIPLFIGNIFQQLYSMVDTMVVGYHLGDSAIAAIGATSTLYSLLINFANGLNSGYAIVVTQRFGAKDITQMKRAIAGMIELDFSISVLLSLLALLLLKPLMVLLNTPSEVFDAAYQYIGIICCGVVVTVGYNMFASILRSVGNSRTPLVFLMISSFLNIGLDLLFVAVFQMGIGGAAFATVLSQAVSATACGYYVFKHYRELLPGKKDFRVPADLLISLVTIGFSTAMASCIVDCGSVIYSRANNLLGEDYITAHAACRKLLMMMIQPQVTISIAFSTFVGQNWGARQFGRIKATLKKILLLEILWSVLAAVIIYLFGSSLVQFTTGTRNPEILRNAVLSLRIHFTTFPFLGILFVMRHALQSMGYRMIPVCSSCIELGMKVVAAFWLIPRIGFLGTCVTEPITWVIMALFLLAFYFLKRQHMEQRLA